MKNKLADFKLDEDKKIMLIQFHHPDLTSKPDIQGMLDEFEDECHKLSENDKYNLVVIKPENVKDVNGQDIYSYLDDELDVRIISKWEKVVVYLERLRKVTLALLEGPITGTAFQLALACDYRLCHPNSVFKFSSIQSGFIPGMAVFRIAKYIGLGRAKQILFTGREIPSTEALSLGLVDEIIADLDTGLANFSSKIHPKNIEAIIMSRRLLNESFHDSYEDEIGDYLAAQVRCYEHVKKFEED